MLDLKVRHYSRSVLLSLTCISLTLLAHFSLLARESRGADWCDDAAEAVAHGAGVSSVRGMKKKEKNIAV